MRPLIWTEHSCDWLKLFYFHLRPPELQYVAPKVIMDFFFSSNDAQNMFPVPGLIWHSLWNTGDAVLMLISERFCLCFQKIWLSLPGKARKSFFLK